MALALLDGVLRAGGSRPALGHRAGGAPPGARYELAAGARSGGGGLGLGALGARGELSTGTSWPADLALIVAAAGLGLRAYNAFTTEGSYAPYYAAPLVLLLGILHERVAARWPQARGAVLAVLGLVAAGLAAYALGGLYVHETRRSTRRAGASLRPPRPARRCRRR